MIYQSKNVGLQLIKKGYAFVDRNYKPSEHVESYQKAEDYAKENKKGFWADGLNKPVRNVQNAKSKKFEPTTLKMKLTELESFAEINF